MHAVNGKQLVPQDHLLITQQKHLFKNRFDGFRLAVDKVGNADEMGHRITSQCLEDNIVLAFPLDLSAGDNASRVAEQYDQEDGRIIGRATAIVIFVMFIESTQVDMVINELMEGKFKGTGLELLLKIYHNHRILVVITL